MAKLNDMLFYCSNDYSPALVAMDTKRGEIRSIEQFKCKQLVTYQDQVYAVQDTSSDAGASCQIVRIDPNTLGTTTVAQNLKIDTTMHVISKNGDSDTGVFFTVDGNGKTYLIKGNTTIQTTHCREDPNLHELVGLCRPYPFEYGDSYQYYSRMALCVITK